MIISDKIAEKVRIKRGRMAMTKTALCTELGIVRKTLAKIEKGNYDAPKRIYESVMNWLIEDF